LGWEYVIDENILILEKINNRMGKSHSKELHNLSKGMRWDEILVKHSLGLMRSGYQILLGNSQKKRLFGTSDEDTRTILESVLYNWIVIM
jgi:hypothetical protein